LTILYNTWVKVDADGQTHGTRRIRSSSSDAGETDLRPSDDSSTQPRRISDPVCHSTSSSAADQSAASVIGYVTHEAVPPRPRQNVTNQRRRLANEEVLLLFVLLY